MPAPTLHPALPLVLADFLGDALARGEAVTVPGLGTFRRRHEPGRIAHENGGTTVVPPADVVDFEPEG